MKRKEEEKEGKFIINSSHYGQCTHFARTKAKLERNILHFQVPSSSSSLSLTLHISSLISTFLSTNSGLPFREVSWTSSGLI